jgi:hypothetical protein
VYISQLVILFVVYLRHCQSLKGYSVEWLLNNELERIWMEAVFA